MYPTLSYLTKYNILSKRHRLGRNLKVGDLVIAKHPSFSSHNAGKRVIGLPGDFVVRDPSGSRTVGGMSVAGGGPPTSEVDRDEPEMIEVPPGHVWVAGDNLSWSRDSRFYGPLPMGLILGKIVRYSNPSSDWMIDMVRAEKDQLKPARRGMAGDDDDWALITRYFSGWEKTTNIKEFDLEAHERS
jgi:signal peptidase I